MSVDRRVGPVRIAKLRGDAWLLCRIKAGACELQDSAEAQVLAHHLCEQRSMRLRRVFPRRKVRHGNTRLFYTQTCANAEPVLAKRGSRRDEHHRAENGPSQQKLLHRPLLVSLWTGQNSFSSHRWLKSKS